MRKILAIFFFASAGLFGAPVGNTSAPSMIERGVFTSCNNSINLRLGYEGDYVADGRMEQENQGQGRVDCYKQGTNSGVVVLNFQDRMDVYGVFGSSKTRADWRFTSLAGSVARIQANTDWDFLWAAGMRVILVEWCNTSLGCGGRYSQSDYQLSHLSSDGISASTQGAQFKWREWQINLDISYKIHIFTPYIGVKYLNARTELNGFSVPISASGSGSNEFKNRDPVGLYLGCGLSNGNYVMLNIEGRLIDEEAITISGDIRF